MFLHQKMNIWDSVIWENLDKSPHSNNTTNINNKENEYDQEIIVENYQYPKFSTNKENVIYLHKDVFNSQLESMYSTNNGAEKQFIIDMHRSDLFINGHSCKKKNPRGVLNYLEWCIDDKLVLKKTITCLTQSIMTIPIFFVHSYLSSKASDLYIGEVQHSCSHIDKSMNINLDINDTINVSISKNMRIFNSNETVCCVNIYIDFDLIGDSPVIMNITPILF